MLEDLKSKVGALADDPKVKATIDKAKEYINSEEGKKKIEEMKEKAEDFVADKTAGKGILGFGKK